MPIERIPLAQPIESRDGTFGKDSYTTNYIFEIRNQKKEVVKRPGLSLIKNINSYTGLTGANTNGFTAFNNSLIAAINGEVIKVNLSGANTSYGSMSNNDSRCYFARSLLDTYLFFHNGDNAYLIDPTKNINPYSGAFTKLAYGSVASFTIGVAGTTPYSETDNINLSAAPAGGTTAVVSANFSTGYPINPNLYNRGAGYTAAPTASIQKSIFANQTGSGSSGANTITVTNGSALTRYLRVAGTGVGTNAQITNIVGNVITVSPVNSGAVSGTLTFTDVGAGFTATTTLTNIPAGLYVPGCVYLDGYVFLGIAATNRIYNSNLNDPINWNALNYVTFQQTNDTLVAISKHINYLVAFGQKSTQFFYDAANATGSPLALADSYTSEVGCASGDSIVSTSNTVLWISTSSANGRSVSMMEGVVAKRISTDYIDRHLLASDLSDVKAFVHTISGHTLYVLTLADIGQTLVYDLTVNEWYSWTQYGTQTYAEASAGTVSEYYFRPGFYALLNGVHYCLDSYNSRLYQLSTTTYQDDSQPIYCRTVTDLADNGTTKRKFYGRLEIVGDKVAGGTMYVSHTGNDYKDYSYSRAIDLNASRSQIYQCGADRRRAWQLLCTSNVPLRLQTAEIDVDVGEMDQTQNVGGGGRR